MKRNTTKSNSKESARPKKDTAHPESHHEIDPSAKDLHSLEKEELSGIDDNKRESIAYSDTDEDENEGSGNGTLGRSTRQDK